MFQKEDYKLLSKLKVVTLLDLALIIPHSYSSNYLSNELVEGVLNVIDATILSVIEKNNLLILTLYANNFQQELNATIFHPKSFHRFKFRVGERLYLKGKITFSYSKLSMNQPQIVNNINTIEIKYKTAFKNSTMLELVKKYINIENLNKEIDQTSASILYHLHFPANHHIKHYIENGIGDIEKQTLKFCEIYNYIQKLKARNRSYEAIKELKNEDELKNFISSLSFKLTNDQTKALNDIKKDLSCKIATKRVIMGDVGSGKTILILASALIAFPSKSVLLVPTTILAKQIYQEAIKLLPKKKRNHEEFEKKLRETLQKRLSVSNISSDVRITFPKTHSVYVCEMFIPKSSIPVYVITKNKDEEFYVRQKKELVRLSPREQKEYIDDNFGDIE